MLKNACIGMHFVFDKYVCCIGYCLNCIVNVLLQLNLSLNMCPTCSGRVLCFQIWDL
jgi:hypothetical protein